jgi:hypothetical protein
MENLIAELAKEVFLANTRRKHTVFFDFAGHVNTVSIYAVKGRWKSKSKRIFDEFVRLYVFDAEKQILMLIKKIKNL